MEELPTMPEYTMQLSIELHPIEISACKSSCGGIVDDTIKTRAFKRLDNLAGIPWREATLI